MMPLLKQQERQGLIKSDLLSLSLALFISLSPSSSDVIMAAQRGRSLRSKIILSNLLPLQPVRERDLHSQPDQRGRRETKGKMENMKEAIKKKEEMWRRGRGGEERKEGYKENMLRRRGGCQAVAAELTQHRISNAVKLQNARQQSSKACWDGAEGGSA